MVSKFVWSDLSTFDVPSAKQFYHDVLKWDYEDTTTGYTICLANGVESAGLYATPDKFQQMGMPSFWMSYIQVGDIQETVSQASTLGGKIEVMPEPAPGGGMIALIRDPAGAGFTCYEGTNLNGRDQEETPGRMNWNELHVSDLAKVKHFYETLFNWEILPSKYAGRYDIVDEEKIAFASIQVVSNKIKGDKEYWGVYFVVENIAQTLASVKSKDGSIVDHYHLANQSISLVTDQQGAFFFLTEKVGATPSPDRQIKWRTTLGLGIVALAVLLNINWMWGLLFLLWVIPDIKSGSTYFMDVIEKNKNPVLYWIIVFTWIVLSAYSFSEIFGNS